VIVGAILTQSTAWANVEKAIANLKRAGVLDPQSLHDLELPSLAVLIRPSGYYNQKAKKLRAFVTYLFAAHAGAIERLLELDMSTLRAELLRIHGIGPETADSIVLYAAGKPTFVVDAYTARVFGRLGFSEANADYATLRQLFMKYLPHDVALFNEYHALIVNHGKRVCSRIPRCDSCVLMMGCAYGAALDV
jgi:endonuclease-3 related protein